MVDVPGLDSGVRKDVGVRVPSLVTSGLVTELEVWGRGETENAADSKSVGLCGLGGSTPPVPTNTEPIGPA